MTTLRRFYYHFRHRYLKMDNLVIIAAIVIAAGWAWGSINMMQRNYVLQSELDAKRREERLADLEVQTLKYQQRYYKSSEYQELSARQNLGLAAPGEKVFVLPPNTEAAKALDTSRQAATEPTTRPVKASNLGEWVNFLFGGNAKGLQS